MKTKTAIIFFAAFLAASIVFFNHGATVNAAAPTLTPPPNVMPPPEPPKQQWPEASFYKWESKDIVKAFSDNKLEVQDAKPGYTMGPLTPRESTIFLIPSFGNDIGGYVSSYNTEDDLKEMREHYIKMNKDPKSPAWRIYEKDNILLLISGKVPEAKAKEYEKVLNGIK
ncbi:MAG: hypothetical protein AAB089_01130 [Nitrospirota bacterium]